MALKTVKIDADRPQAETAQPQSAPAQAQPAVAAAPATAAAKGAAFRKRFLPIAGGLVLLVALGLGGNWFFNGRYEITTDNAQIKSDVTLISPKVQGYIATVAIRQNQKVQKGDLLFTIDKSDYEARVAAARADLTQAEADAAQSKARIGAQSAAINVAQARAAAARDQLKEAQATADWQSSDLKRKSDLAEQGWYPKAKIEQDRANEKAARAGVTAQSSQVTSAEAAVRQAREEVAAATSSAASAEAKIEAARAKLTAAELDLSRTEVRSPITGQVSNAQIVPGMLLQPGAVTMVIVPAVDAYVIANYKETQISGMAPGQKAHFKVDAYHDLKCNGTLESIGAATGATFSLIPQDTATGNFTKIVQRVPVKFLIDKDCLATGKMRTGQNVVVTVDTKPAK